MIYTTTILHGYIKYATLVVTVGHTYHVNVIIAILQLDFLLLLQLPEVCDYDDAKYSVLIFYDNGSIAYRSIERTYDKDGQDSVEFKVSENLQNDLSYTVQIYVSTAVNWTTTQFQFGK